LKLGIAIPTYNEAGNISNLIDQIFINIKDLSKLDTTVLIIDDTSPDGTGEIVKKLSKKYSSRNNFEIKLLSRKVMNGLGKAYIEGFNYLLNMDMDFILQMDADLSHNPVYLPAFVNSAKNKTELTIGSRYMNGGETPDWALSRRFLSKSGNIYARLILGSHLSDYTGGYNMYSSSLLKRIKVGSIQASGYGFLVELKYKASKLTTSINQVPIVFNDRQHGKSKIPKTTILKNLLLVPVLRLTKI